MTHRDEMVGDEWCVVVFTCRGKERMIREGGSQAWRIDASRASKCNYVVCVQNRNETWGQASAPHKQAFLIAEISEISQSKESPNRQIIKFKSYADLAVPDRWDGNRNPVAYGHLRDFGINTLDDLEELSLCRLGTTFSFGVDASGESPGDDYDAAAIGCDQIEQEAEGEEREIVPLSFEDAKRGLALRYEVAPEQIEIVIRG